MKGKKKEKENIRGFGGPGPGYGLGGTARASRAGRADFCCWAKRTVKN